MLFLLLNSSFIKDIKQGNKLSVQALTGIIKKGEAVSSSIKNAHIGSMRKQILEIVLRQVESHAHNTCVIITLGVLVFSIIKNTFIKHHF